MNSTTIVHEPLFNGSEWTEESIRRTYDAIETIALREFGLSVYESRIEPITSEQMLDRYAGNGMPFMYRHWSFGKHFAREQARYRMGGGLAYEIVINTDPCIVHLMEDNSMTMQALTIAHAAFGHNHFFKNNHLFKQWTDAKGIISYLAFARSYIAKCEEKHGAAEVERLLDAAHALENLGVDRALRPKTLTFAEEERRQQTRLEKAALSYNELWSTIPEREAPAAEDAERDKRRAKLNLPEENLLYFLEKRSPRLQPWQKEVLRIVRNIAQYFYPQRQTKVMNEGCATFVHYETMVRLYEKGLLTEGSMLEFLQSHTGVIFQPDFDHPRFGGINPYALGFAMMRDIKRIATEPTAEDLQWFSGFAGKGDPWGVLKDAWGNYRDESFILQYLSPEVIRKFRFFNVYDAEGDDNLLVDAIHDGRGYRKIREVLAGQYDLAQNEPDIRVEDVDLDGDRTLILHHAINNGVLLEEYDTAKVLAHLAFLWGYRVVLLEVDERDGEILAEHSAP